MQKILISLEAEDIRILDELAKVEQENATVKERGYRPAVIRKLLRIAYCYFDMEKEITDVMNVIENQMGGMSEGDEKNISFAISNLLQKYQYHCQYGYTRLEK